MGIDVASDMSTAQRGGDEVDYLRAEVERLKREHGCLLDAARNAIPESEYPKEPTAGNWAFQLRALGEDRRAAYRLLEEARAKLASARRAAMEEAATKADRQAERSERAEIAAVCDGNRPESAAARGESRALRHFANTIRAAAKEEKR